MALADRVADSAEDRNGQKETKTKKEEQWDEYRMQFFFWQCAYFHLGDP